jgi:hypothetical protein
MAANEKSRRARYKLVCTMLTTYGYALLGVAAIELLQSAKGTLTPAQALALAVGIAFQAYAV